MNRQISQKSSGKNLKMSFKTFANIYLKCFEKTSFASGNWKVPKVSETECELTMICDSSKN